MRYLNKLLGIFMISVNCVLIIAYIIFVKIGVVIPDYLGLLIGASAVSIIAYVYAFIKLLDSVAFRYVVLAFNCLIYIGIIFWTGVDIGYIAGMAVALIYILYMDTKFMYWLMIVICMPNIVSIAMNVTNGHMHDGSPLHITSLVMQFFAIMWYCYLLRYVISIVVKYNNEKLEKIREANEKTTALMNGLLEVADVVRHNVEDSTELINELDVATEHTNLIFNRIAEGNESNANSVETQTEMTAKITSLIGNVAKEVSSAQVTSKESVDDLKSSKEFLHELQKNSAEIIDVNRKIFEAIDNFVTSSKEVKKMTAGIDELSEEINLLSINATIESAKAGEAGKGFAVVAKAVNRLAVQTAFFTEDIQEIINKLSEDATNAKGLIDVVEQTVAKENKVLGSTISEFNSMEEKMNALSKEMKDVLGSTKEVVAFNEIIREHIEQLSAQTEEVTAYIEEAVSLNSRNKDKMSDTTRMMRELGVAVEQLKEN